MASDQAEKWAEAMQQEMQSLIDHQTWKFILKQNVEPGHRPLKEKWVYKIKRGVDNQITRFKARWVVKGYLQQAGVDFDQTFAAIVKPMAFRALFAIATFYELDIEEIDVKTVFLHGIIDELFYNEVPKGYEDEQKNQVCLLKKSFVWLETVTPSLVQTVGRVSFYKIGPSTNSCGPQYICHK